MVGTLQPLDDKFPIAQADGRPTQYFIRWAQQRQIDIGGGITAEQALAIVVQYLADHVLQEGLGISITPSGNLTDNPTIAAEVQAILDSISNVQGTILFRGVADWEALAPGTAGDFLKTNGAGADPEWDTAGGGGGGGLVLIEQHTAAASASLDFAASISATYDEYLIEFVNIIPATNAVNLRMRMSTDGGATYDSGANYSFVVSGLNRFGLGQVGADSGQNFIRLTQSAIDNTATAGVSGSIRLFSPLSTALHKNITGQLNLLTGGVLETQQASGWYRSTTAVDAFQFLMSSGNITSGNIRVYGLAK